MVYKQECLPAAAVIAILESISPEKITRINDYVLGYPSRTASKQLGKYVRSIHICKENGYINVACSDDTKEAKNEIKTHIIIPLAGVFKLEWEKAD